MRLHEHDLVSGREQLHEAEDPAALACESVYGPLFVRERIHTGLQLPSQRRVGGVVYAQYHQRGYGHRDDPVLGDDEGGVHVVGRVLERGRVYNRFGSARYRKIPTNNDGEGRKRIR